MVIIYYPIGNKTKEQRQEAIMFENIETENNATLFALQLVKYSQSKDAVATFDSNGTVWVVANKRGIVGFKKQ